MIGQTIKNVVKFFYVLLEFFCIQHALTNSDPNHG